MRPDDLTAFPNELAVRWDDGSESFIPFETLRRFCPCAACMGEQDIFGNTYKAPERPYAKNAFQLVRFSEVGSYAVQPFWADGHGSGIFAWDYLRRVATAQADAEKSPAKSDS